MSDTTNSIPQRADAAQIVPDRIVAGFRAIALLLATAMLCLAAPSLLNDPDTLWHIKVGGDIRAAGAFPVVDTYSHTFAGEPWIAKQWLSGVILAGAHGLGGWNGVVGLSIAALLAAFWMITTQLSRHLNPMTALILSLWMFAASSSAFLARPHALALPVAVWFILHVWNAASERRAPRWIALAALALWANLHGSFTLGFIAAGTAFLHLVVTDTELASPRNWTLETMRRRGEVRRWIAFGLLCPVAACVHPYGWQSIASTFIIADNAILDHIGEWKPFTFGTDRVASLTLIGAFVAALATPLRTSLPKALFIAFLLAIYLTHTRFAPFLFLLPAALLTADIAKAFPNLSAQRWRGEAQWDAVQAALGRFFRPVVGVIALAGGALFVQAALLSDLKPAARHYPTEALAAVRAAGVSGPVMNSYDFGGALIFEGIPTFVDGRADRLFDNGAFIAAYFDAAGDAEAVTAYLTDHAIGWTLLNPRDPNVAVMDALDGWQRLYADDNAIVHVPVDG